MPRLLSACVIACLVLPPVGSHASAQDWRPIDPADVALKDAKVQRGADAEALLWEVRVSDDMNSVGDVVTVFHHYVRLKIFTERGRERYSTIDIPYASGIEVRDVVARTIRPDGSTVELPPSDLHRRTLVKAGDVKVKAISFDVPAIERGAIVEYRWREMHRVSLAQNLVLPFSRDVPVHLVRYYFRRLEIPGHAMIVWSLNGQLPPSVRQRDGSSMIALTNVDADVDEDYSTPSLERRPWIFISYLSLDKYQSMEEFLRAFSKRLAEEYSNRSTPNDAIRALAASAIAGAATDADKVAALVRVARSTIRRVDVDTAPPEDLRKARDARTASDLLNDRIGTADDVVALFLALANAVDLDARVAAVASRAEIFERSMKPHPYFLRGRLVAVRSGSSWIYADPTNEYAAKGQLRWEYQDQRVLIADRRETLVGRTPIAPPSYSLKLRTGTFTLLEDGTLEGEASFEYTGHWGETFREQEDQDTTAERERDLRQLVTRRLPGAQISDIRLAYATDLGAPYTTRYRVRVPGFAQKTGWGLTLQPSFFQKGMEPFFVSAERKTNIYFPFAWTEEDVVTIDLPPGYSVDPAALPKPMNIGAARYEARLEASGERLVYRRTLAVGTDGIFFNAPVAYQPLRGFFEGVRRVDAHTVTLRRKDGQQ